MARAIGKGFGRFRAGLRRALSGPQALAFLPAITLAGYWIGGERVLVAIAILLPALFALAGLYARQVAPAEAPPDPVTGLATAETAAARCDALLAEGPTRLQTTATLAIGIDEFSEFEERQGAAAARMVLQATAERVQGAVRETDIVFRLDGPRIGVVLASGRRTDFETLIQLATRIQRAVDAPFSLDGTRIYASVSVGFCQPGRLAEAAGAALIAAAGHALDEAMAHGTGAIRAYSEDMGTRARARGALADELPRALEEGRIVPWFQPQVVAGTGALAGFEVLARWDHPERGIVAPGEFLPAAEDLGLLDRLGETMLYQSLNALRAWDAAGLEVPVISVNFSAGELRDPKIVDKIRWELDRFSLAPGRLAIEVLETVIAQSVNDTIVRNLRAFAELGCKIDLDDFGTGNASITSIKRFSVGRLKIDRSFVTRLDTDLEQQNLVAAIITLAERLELETLAEGVETPAEHAVLSRLGCGYVQGFGIARPMPFEAVEPWITAHAARLSAPGPAAEPAPDPAPELHGKLA